MSAKELEKLIGQVIEIIYEDKSGNITQRRIEVHGIKGGLLRATCLTTGGPRVFRTANILAWRQAKARYADDTARKLLRIMYHFSNHFRRMPTLPELARLSGRTPAGIYSGFRELVLEGHIQWQPPQPIESAVILVAWETPEPGAHTSISGHWRD